MPKKIAFGIIVATLLLAGCARAAVPMPEPVTQVVEVERVVEEAMPDAPMEAPAMEYAEGGSGFDASNKNAAPSERIVLTNVNMGIIVEDPDESMKAIGKMAEGMGGFIVYANLYQTGLPGGEQAHQGTITVRVPAERIDEALTFIEGQSQEPLEYKNIDSQDVTRDYINLKSRLRNLQAAEEQLIKIMNDAYETEDVLSVYNQLVSVQEQIEVIQGEINYYEEASRLSAVSVDLIPAASVEPLTVAGWQPVGIARDAVQALINSLQVLVNAAIWIVLFVLPVLLVIAIPILIFVYILLRWNKRRKQKRDATTIEGTKDAEDQSSD